MAYDYSFKFGGVSYHDENYSDFWCYETEPGHELREWLISYSTASGSFWGTLYLRENIESELVDFRKLTDDEVRKVVKILPLMWKLRCAVFKNIE